MSFDRLLLPDPLSYYESEGLRLVGGGKWRTTSCTFHGGSDSMRVNLDTGFFQCMACDEKGDLVAYHMAAHGLEFVEAAKDLGAWGESATPAPQHKPTPLSPRAALQLVGVEAMVVAVIVSGVASGKPLSESDRVRLMQGIGRIVGVTEMFK